MYQTKSTRTHARRSKMKRDFKERFFKFETVRGLILVPAGAVLMITTWTHFQFALQAFFSLIGFYWFIDGLRKIFVNRVKQQVKFQKEAARHEENKKWP